MKSFKLINQSLYSYDGVIKEYIDRYKFQGDYRLRKLVATQITELIKKYEVVVPIPINQVTMGVRKFNQVTGWLEEVNYTMVLTAKPKLKAQFQKNRSERLQTQQPFAMNEKYVEMIKQKQICLVDDIYTTGTTLHHAAQLLLDNGAQSVRSITLAR
ncbi:ComF family protein [Fructilactobacillus lindneri]|uniref:ComF family protein n=1 Tax=Fructilactobacillus lindneri TaxID=53444 RepID=UPI0014310B25|nr:phosphoribosyltransferase family protein [Fructilactobacillus lindneri]